jgi:phage shock protein C
MYRLRRVNRKEAKIFGVCGGISKYIDREMDPVVMRIIWVALSLFQPFFIILYLILALVLKQEEVEED